MVGSVGWRAGTASFFSSSFFSCTFVSSTFVSSYFFSSSYFYSSFFSSSTFLKGSSLSVNLDLTVLLAGMEVKVFPGSSWVAGVSVPSCFLAKCLPTGTRLTLPSRLNPPPLPGPPLPRPLWGVGLDSSFSFWTDAPLPLPLPPGGYPSFVEPLFPRADVGVLLPLILLIYDSSISYFFF